jgi:hypothetical protein
MLILAGLANAQQLYVSLGPGIGLGTACTSDLISSNDKIYPVGLGKSFNINLHAGYELNDFLAIDLGVAYRMGLSTKHDVDGSTYPQKATWGEGTIKLKGSMLQIVPGLVIAPVTESKLRAYGRIGLIIGLMPSILEKGDLLFPYASTVDNDVYTFKYHGGMAIGGQAAIGADFSLSDLLSLYAEIYFDALSYTPKKGEYTKYEVNGKDVLPDFTTQDKEYEYVKDISGYNPSAGSPTQILRDSYPFNNAGLNLGVKIKL